MRKKPGQWSLPAEELHLWIIPSLCPVKLLSKPGSQLFMPGVQCGLAAALSTRCDCPASRLVHGSPLPPTRWLSLGQPQFRVPLGSLGNGFPMLLTQNNKVVLDGKPSDHSRAHSHSYRASILPDTPVSRIPTLPCFLRGTGIQVSISPAL